MPSITAGKPRPIACFGAVHWDIIAHADRRILRDTSTPAHLDQKPGGVATNVARALARLGIETYLIGAIGSDPAARAIREQLNRDGVMPFLLERPDFATGQYLALHDPDGGLAAACIDDKVLSTAPEAHFIQSAETPPPDALWFVDANLPAPILARLSELAPDGALIADGVSEAKAPRLRSILPKLALCLLNRAEALALTDLPGSTSTPDLSARLLELGAAAVVITAGSDPLHYRRADGAGEIPSPAAKIVDVTGAGDALIAGTLAARARGFDLTSALSVGQRAARATLECTGAVPSLLNWPLVAGSNPTLPTP
jgi:pseudouridine kinase